MHNGPNCCQYNANAHQLDSAISWTVDSKFAKEKSKQWMRLPVLLGGEQKSHEMVSEKGCRLDKQKSGDLWMVYRRLTGSVEELFRFIEI